MKRLLVVFVVVFSLMVSPCFAIEYCKDFLESGNPGGWSESSKTFDDEWTMKVGDEVKLDIWINDVPLSLLSGGFWIEYDPSRVSIVSVDAYDGYVFPGPWEVAFTSIIPEPSGPGTYMVLVGPPLMPASPDGDGDIIIAKVIFRCESEGDATITISTIPGLDTFVGDTTVFDGDITENNVVIHQEIDYCEGDFDNDGDQDGSDAALFKTDFGRSPYSSPCPSTTTTIPGGCPSGLTDCTGLCVDTETNEIHCGECDFPCGSGEVCIAGTCEIYCSDNYAPVSKTGQTTSYATGDDGDLAKGVPWPNPRFTDNLDGTVTDNLTGLIWLKDANCFGYRTWNNALSDSNGLESGECGLTDGSSAGEWRLPQLKELMSVFDLGNYSPALPNVHPFINVPSGSSNFWSSTTDSSWDIRAHFVYLTTGGTGANSKTSLYIVWPVRGGH
jgi:hypothetical protein